MASKAGSQEEIDALVGDTGAVTDGGKVGGGKGRKRFIIIVGLVLLLVLAGAGAYFTGALDGLLGKKDTHVAAEQQKVYAKPLFFELPDLIVNISTGTARVAYLKIQLSLQYSDPLLTPVLKNLQPRIIDSFQVYLRELRLSDLSGSAGLIRLKEELLARVNQIVTQGSIKDVLFKQMLVQ